MPLSDPVPRREIHHRVIDMKAFAREDGLFDVEARLVDSKPYEFKRIGSPEPVPAGTALHDLAIRMSIDAQFVVHQIEARSDVTPYGICREAEATLSVLVGERIASGWSTKVKSALRGAASCTHLMEMLLPMATTALQGIRALNRDRGRAVDAQGVPVQIDTCYAYAGHREVVKMLWPEHHQRARDGRSTR